MEATAIDLIEGMAKEAMRPSADNPYKDEIARLLAIARTTKSPKCRRDHLKAVARLRRKEEKLCKK